MTSAYIPPHLRHHNNPKQSKEEKKINAQHIDTGTTKFSKPKLNNKGGGGSGGGRNNTPNTPPPFKETSYTPRVSNNTYVLAFTLEPWFREELGTVINDLKQLCINHIKWERVNMLHAPLFEMKLNEAQFSHLIDCKKTPAFADLLSVQVSLKNIVIRSANLAKQRFGVHIQDTENVMQDFLFQIEKQLHEWKIYDLTCTFAQPNPCIILGVASEQADLRDFASLPELDIGLATMCELTLFETLNLPTGTVYKQIQTYRLGRNPDHKTQENSHDISFPHMINSTSTATSTSTSTSTEVNLTCGSKIRNKPMNYSSLIPDLHTTK